MRYDGKNKKEETKAAYKLVKERIIIPTKLSKLLIHPNDCHWQQWALNFLLKRYLE